MSISHKESKSEKQLSHQDGNKNPAALLHYTRKLSQLGLHCEFHEVLHEDAQTDIVCEDARACRPVAGVVRYTWVELGNDEAAFALVLVANDEPRHREAVVHDSLRVGLRSHQQVCEVLVLLVLMVLLIAPHRHFLSMEHHHMEKGIQKQDSV